VYALDDRRVLRRYRREADVTGEVATMRYLAGLGYPVPAVYEAAGADIVMERLGGPTMAEAFGTGVLGIEEGADCLAGLLSHLHELPTWPGAAAGSRILHLDLHPENVIMTDRGPVVIDWCNARPGDPDLDTGLTALILAQVAADPGHERAVVAEQALTAFLRRAPGAPTRLLEDVVRFRDRQLDGTERLDLAAEKVLACAR
jgi:aminoglycoside phosphotransferase (APT) family kinase protein